MADLERTWKVGELARDTGLTIRALHHYDDIGLLVPGRTQAGHRVYGPAEVERLYRVLALRGVGLALDEIGAVLDDAGVSLVDTVRRHVAAVERDIAHRQALLDRLRAMLDGLEHASSPSVDHLIGTVEAMSVVEATIEDVYFRAWHEHVQEPQAPHVVVLRELSGERVVPIWIGQPEAAALVMGRRGQRTPRPMTPDLALGLLEAAGARIERVVVESLRENTYFATVVVIVDGETREVDARPSDALNLATRAQVPIHVAADIVAAAGLTAWPAAHDPGDGGAAHEHWIRVEDRRSTPPLIRIGTDSSATLRCAAEQARSLGHGWVRCEHLLLAVLGDEGGVAARLLADRGLTIDRARTTVVAGSGDPADVPAPGGGVGLSPQAQRALRIARAEAWSMGTEAAGAGHLLLGVVQAGDSAALEILRDAGVGLPELYAELLAALRG